MSRLSGNCCCLSACFNQAQKRPWSKHLHVQGALSSLTEKPACNTRPKQLQYLSCQQQQHLQIQSSAQTVPEVNGQLHLLAPNQKSALQNTPGTEKGFPALLLSPPILCCCLVLVYSASLFNWYGPLSMKDNFSISEQQIHWSNSLPIAYSLQNLTEGITSGFIFILPLFSFSSSSLYMHYLSLYLSAIYTATAV